MFRFIKRKLKAYIVHQIEEYNKKELIQRNKLILNNITVSDNFQVRPFVKIRNLSNNAKNILIGKNTIIDGELLVFNYGGCIKIGDYSYIGENSKIWSAEKIEIGSNVLISHNCNIFDTDSHELNYLKREEGYKFILANGYQTKNPGINCSSIVIEDNVWISFNVTILKGVKIGKGAIIGANTVVIDDVPPFSLVIGNPARIVKENLDKKYD